MKQADDFKSLFKSLDVEVSAPQELKENIYNNIVYYKGEPLLNTEYIIEKMIKIIIPASIAMNFILELKVL